MGNLLPNDLQLTDKMMMSVIIRSNHSNYNLPADTQTIWFTVNIFSSAIARSLLKQERRQTTSISNKCSCWWVEFRDVWGGKFPFMSVPNPPRGQTTTRAATKRLFLCAQTGTAVRQVQRYSHVWACVISEFFIKLVAEVLIFFGRLTLTYAHI